jgi:NAD(P)-dependent dehydrogenase (short-subunit alcohol dehydrogenase family)
MDIGRERHPRFTDRVVIVSGAGAAKGSGWGNGRATAVGFAAEGAKVVVVDLHADRAEETRDMIARDGGQAMVVAADVTDRQQVAALVARTLESYGRIDVLHNNVGLAGGASGLIEAISDKAWDREMAVSAKSVFLTVQAVLPTMIAQGAGVITNTSSTLAVRAIEMPSLTYTAAKAAVEAMTQSLAVSHGPRGIRVNCLRIGFMDTPLNRASWSHQIDGQAAMERAMAASASVVPLRRMGTGLDSAAAALFLASDEASYLNGVILPVDGGVELAPVHIPGLFDEIAKG